MKRVFYVVLFAAFAAVSSAADAKAETKAAQPNEGCCSKPKTVQTSLDQPKTEPKAQSSCCSSCCSQTSARKTAAKRPLLSPKATELARR